MKAHHKYRPYRPVQLTDRTWPDRGIHHAPRWCSVDLRDGNQALPVPMNPDEKLELFRTLTAIGFEEIEAGFPSASQMDFEFIRRLFQGRDENDAPLCPEHVTIQVISQAREALIRRTFEALPGCRRAIFHLYNSTNPEQRRQVFRLDRAGIVDIAVRHTRLVRELARQLYEEDGSRIVLQYSPESFSSTEPDFAVEICAAVMETWQPTAEEPIILNLPATVERSGPHIFADQIEYFHRNLPDRERAVISIHPHNDRGCAVAAAEFGIQAGGERIEGTLFGNGERTGNVDLVTLALNLHSQGVDPRLDFSNIDAVRETYERCTRMRVHERHPYAGDLVYTAFSGSHQDAIRKGFTYRKEQLTAAERAATWEVPYLPVDPADVGRSYEAVVRVNSQSGKGGAAFLLERDYGLSLPKMMLPVFGRNIQARVDAEERELSAAEIHAVFEEDFLAKGGNVRILEIAQDERSCSVRFTLQDSRTYSGSGAGPIEACRDALRDVLPEFEVVHYSESARGSGTAAEAVAYVAVRFGNEGELHWGAGMDRSITTASLRALFSAVPVISKDTLSVG